MKHTELILALLGVALVSTVLPAASLQLPAGQYMSSLSPSVSEAEADKIEKELRLIQEIHRIDVKPRDSTLHFTVKSKAQLDFSRLSILVQTAVPGTLVSEPVADEPMAWSGDAKRDQASAQGY